MFYILSLTKCLLRRTKKLNNLFEIAKNLYGNLNNCVTILLKIMGEKYWAPNIIDSVKGIFGKSGSSHAQSNHASVKKYVILNVDGRNDAM